MAGIFSYGLGLEDLDENRAEAPVEGDTVVEERVEENEVVEKTDDQVTDAEATDAPAEAPVEGAPTDGEAEEVKDAEDAAEAEAEAEVLENEQLETELLEAQAEEQEIHEMDDAMEDAEGALDDHQELIESLEMIAQDGGMNRQAARFYQLSRKSIYGRLGIRVTTESFAMEAFDDVATRVVATVRSLEEEKSNFKKFFEGTKKFLMDLFEKIKNFILKILDTNNAVRKRAENLSKKLDKASFEGTLSEAQQKRLGKYFVVEGKTVSLSEAEAYTIKECDKAAVLPDNKFFFGVIKEYVASIETDRIPIPVTKTDVLKMFQEKLLDKVSLEATDKDAILASFPGNYQLKVGGIETGTTATTFAQDEEVGEVSIGKELMPTAEQAGKALDFIFEILKGVDQINSDMKKNDNPNMFGSIIEKLSNNSDRHAEGDSPRTTYKKNAVYILGAYITFIRQYNGSIVKFSSYLSTLARAYLEVIETAALGKAKEASAAGEPAKA